MPENKTAEMAGFVARKIGWTDIQELPAFAAGEMVLWGKPPENVVQGLEICYCHFPLEHYRQCSVELQHDGRHVSVIPGSLYRIPDWLHSVDAQLASGGPVEWCSNNGWYIKILLYTTGGFDIQLRCIRRCKLYGELITASGTGLHNFAAALFRAVCEAMKKGYDI